MTRKAVFIDKDGTLIKDVPYNVDPGLISLCEGAVEALRQLKASGYSLVLVSNQSGVAHGYFKEEALKTVKTSIQRMLAEEDAGFDAFYFCPHHPQGSVDAYAKACTCRKPAPGMLLAAARDLGIDLSASWMVGDILHDVEAGTRAGCKTILINNGNESEWILTGRRNPTAIVDNLRQAADLITLELRIV